MMSIRLKISLFNNSMWAHSQTHLASDIFAGVQQARVVKTQIFAGVQQARVVKTQIFAGVQQARVVKTQIVV